MTHRILIIVLGYPLEERTLQLQRLLDDCGLAAGLAAGVPAAQSIDDHTCELLGGCRRFLPA